MAQPVPAYGTQITAGYAPGQSAPAMFDPNTGQPLVNPNASNLTPPQNYTTDNGQQVTYNPSLGTYSNQPLPSGQQYIVPPTGPNPNVTAPTNPTQTNPQTPPGNTGGSAGGTGITPDTSAQISPDEQAKIDSLQSQPDAQKVLQQYYQNLHASKGGSTAPDTMPRGGTSVDGTPDTGIPTYESTQAPDPTTEAVNTESANLLADIANKNNFDATKQSVASYTLSESNALGIPGMETSLMNINNLMNGTENDVRTEISAAGGFATESQVEALTATRNKVLLLQASNLQNALSNAQNNLSLNVAAFQGDQQNASAALDDKVNGDQTALSLFQNIQTNANANYNRVFAASGWDGIAALGDSQKANIEDTWGLPPGALSNPAWVNGQQQALYRQQQLMNSKANITINEIKADAQAGYYEARTTQADINAAQGVISNYVDLPGYTSFTAAQPIMGRIDEAANKPGSVSDAELVRAFGNLTNVNTAVTDSEAGSISGGKSFVQNFQQLQNLVVTQGGSLSQNQRDQIYTLSHAIYNNYKNQYTPIYNNAVGQLNDSNLPTGVLPNPNTFNMADPNIQNSAGVTIGGQTYASGQIIPVANGSLTVQPDGSLLGSDNYTYHVVNGQIQ